MRERWVSAFTLKISDPRFLDRSSEMLVFCFFATTSCFFYLMRNDVLRTSIGRPNAEFFT